MNDQKDTNEGINDLVKLIAILVKRDRSQTSLIVEMGEVGISSAKIANLLGTSPNTVSVTLSKYKKNKK
jgi:hypothetical protein